MAQGQEGKVNVLPEFPALFDLAQRGNRMAVGDRGIGEVTALDEPGSGEGVLAESCLSDGTLGVRVGAGHVDQWTVEQCGRPDDWRVVAWFFFLHSSIAHGIYHAVHGGVKVGSGWDRKRDQVEAAD